MFQRRFFPEAAVSRQRRAKLRGGDRAGHRQHFVDRLRQPVRLNRLEVEPAARLVEPAEAVDQRHGLPHQPGKRGGVGFAGTARGFSADARQSATGVASYSGRSATGVASYNGRSTTGVASCSGDRPLGLFDRRQAVEVDVALGHIDGGRDGQNLVGLNGQPPLLAATNVYDLERDQPIEQPVAHGHAFERHAHGGQSLVGQLGFELRRSAGQAIRDQGQGAVHCRRGDGGVFRPLGQLGANLADPLPRDAETGADFGERVLPAVLPTVVADEDVTVPLERG